jgi:hypothetical protein
VRADCLACWQRPNPAARAAWRLDWIDPAPPDGPKAPMADAALPESLARRQRRSQAAWQAPRAHWASTADSLSVTGGPAWNGYMGVQVTFQRLGAPVTVASAGPAGASDRPRRHSPGATGTAGQGPAAGWPQGARFLAALVEHVPADTAGNPETRALVRAVAGPWPVPPPLAAPRWHHWLAMRLPEAARPDRLRLRAWVEDARGQVIAMAADACDPNPGTDADADADAN